MNICNHGRFSFSVSRGSFPSSRTNSYVTEGSWYTFHHTKHYLLEPRFRNMYRLKTILNTAGRQAVQIKKDPLDYSPQIQRPQLRFPKMRFTSSLLALAAASTATAIELTPDNWDTETAGKTVFIKFLAPWWGHCKKMKPDWDKLMEAFAGSATQLVADGE